MMGREQGKKIGPYSRWRRPARPRGFAAWLDAERIRLDLTIQQLIVVAGIGRRTMYGVLAGKVPSFRTRNKLKAAIRAAKELKEKGALRVDA